MRPFFAVLTLSLLTGCASEPAAVRKQAPKVKPELAMILPDASSASPESALPPHLPNQSAVLIAPDVIAYPIAARQDPNQPDLMYAGTWAFRRTAPRWRLAPAPAQEVSLGPITRDDRSSIQPLQNQELTASWLEARAQNDQNRQAISRLIRLQEELQKQVAELKVRTISPDGHPAAKEDDVILPPRPAPAETSVKDSASSVSASR